MSWPSRSPDGPSSVALPPAFLSTKHGAQRVVTDSAAPIVDDAGKTVGGVIVFRDETERRHLENRLAQSERLAAMGTLSAGMAHEINTRCPTCSPMWRLPSTRCTRSKRSCERCPKQRPSTSRPAWGKLRTLCELGQVFINSLVNAAQAFGEGPVETREIVVATRTDEAGRAVGEVRDAGAGIPPEILRRIFDPFFTTKSFGQGTGLGLSIAHSIVESLGGSIPVESRVGKGTTFRVALPPAKQRAAKPAPAGHAPPVRRGRVLVIDDEASIGRAMCRVLKSEHDVFVVTDALEVLPRVAAGERFDVVFCDLMMPGMTGMDFFEVLREAQPELARRIVFVTGGAVTARAEWFLRKTRNETLTKPVDPGALRRIVGDYVRSEQGGGRPD